ncbi:MAG: 5-formyltetrahydrofolate cyclo-ligase [Cyclobacteriaceae bacterium]|nr:MAG: 5-formyltetrahydrofolate cyclo-ligase [Cyclobacteriaceae bacterium]
MDKSQLRHRYLSNRQSLTRFQVQSRNQLISQRLINYVSWTDLNLVHFYLPIVRNQEIDTFPIIEYLRKHYPAVRIAVPKVVQEHTLDHYLLTDRTKLELNLWGIPEPANATAIPLDQIDLVVTPMVIFDRAGHRVGYGKGYYDRFLAKCRPDTRKIGLCYFEPVEQIDFESTDIAMDVVVTPDGIWEFE